MVQPGLYGGFQSRQRPIRMGAVWNSLGLIPADDQPTHLELQNQFGMVQAVVKGRAYSEHGTHFAK